MRTFAEKLERVLRETDELQRSADLNQLATQITGDASTKLSKRPLTGQPPPEQQVDRAAQQQADGFRKQYDDAQSEAEKAEQDAQQRQDVGLFNKAANARKRADDLSKSYQLAQNKATGQTAGPQQIGQPPSPLR